MVCHGPKENPPGSLKQNSSLHPQTTFSSLQQKKTLAFVLLILESLFLVTPKREDNDGPEKDSTQVQPGEPVI